MNVDVMRILLWWDFGIVKQYEADHTMFIFDKMFTFPLKKSMYLTSRQKLIERLPWALETHTWYPEGSLLPGVVVYGPGQHPFQIQDLFSASSWAHDVRTRSCEHQLYLQHTLQYLHVESSGPFLAVNVKQKLHILGNDYCEFEGYQPGNKELHPVACGNARYVKVSLLLAEFWRWKASWKVFRRVRKMLLKRLSSCSTFEPGIVLFVLKDYVILEMKPLK
jgi:hypothetical protein